NRSLPSTQMRHLICSLLRKRCITSLILQQRGILIGCLHHACESSMAQTLAHQRPAGLSASSAFTFVLMMGVVNLFADMTYEGASSINGPFLGSLGATAAAIGVISGVGEFLGYSLRFIAGYISDKTGKYWLITFI